MIVGSKAGASDRARCEGIASGAPVAAADTVVIKPLGGRSAHGGTNVTAGSTPWRASSRRRRKGPVLEGAVTKDAAVDCYHRAVLSIIL